MLGVFFCLFDKHVSFLCDDPTPKIDTLIFFSHFQIILTSCRNYADGPAPGDEVRPARPNGEHTCDSPLGLEQSMYKAIQRLVPDAAFSIFTGDIVDHAVWNTTMIQNTLDVTNAYDRMAAAGMLVYGAVGNHEASPANSYPPLAVSPSMQWLYDVLSSSWTRWVGTRAADTTRVFGAYSAKYPHGNLRVISLSTNLYYVHNYWLYEEPMEKDPSGQLAWLIGELDAAEKAGERVYIIGHMAPGARDAFHDASNYFDQIVNRYEATIAALFFGTFTAVSSFTHTRICIYVCMLTLCS